MRQMLEEIEKYKQEMREKERLLKESQDEL